MKKLREVDKYKYIEHETIKVYCRVFTRTEIPDRVFIERTTVYADGRLFCRWYCPTIAEYKGHKKVMLSNKQKKPYMSIGGCAGLSYWFDKYLPKKPLQ